MAASNSPAWAALARRYGRVDGALDEPVLLDVTQGLRQEERIAAGGHGMSDPEIEKFVEYFWKALHPALFLPPLLNDPTRANLVMEIDADHTPVRLYSNSQSSALRL